MIGISQAFKQYALETILSSESIHLALLNFVPRSHTINENGLSAGLFTIPNHNFVDGLRVQVSVPASEIFPSGLVAGTTYFVRNATENNFRLSATLGGSPIQAEPNGLATITELPPLIENSSATLQQLVHHEVARVKTLLVANSLPRPEGGYQTPFTQVSYTAVESMLFTHYAIYFQSLDLSKDITGSLLSIRQLEEPQALAKNQTIDIPIRFFIDQISSEVA